ncbi:MAG: peptidase [Planctomycetaceae bacterium]|nr:peptidase [Planctomycetaceae bacterium]|tara:strand:+ start:310 stop:927 length:618 start_codon:yes stop_codon:yes gene_type:complete
MAVDQPTRTRRRYWIKKSAGFFRWLHIYLSMISFATLMLFAITGITLNHPGWFGADQEFITDESGSINTDWISGDIDRLAIVESLRVQHNLKGAVSEFVSDEFECMVVFKGPGYAADVFIDRNSGDYTLTQISTGAVAILNDLHKGRDSGIAWSWVIDISAILMILVSITGLVLLFYLKKRRRSGLIVTFFGLIALVLVWAFWVP